MARKFSRAGALPLVCSGGRRGSQPCAILVDDIEAFGWVDESWVFGHRDLVLGLRIPLVLRSWTSMLVIGAGRRVGPDVEPSLVELDYLSRGRRAKGCQALLDAWVRSSCAF